MSNKKETRVKKWLLHGELNPRNHKLSSVIEECGRLLDKSCTGDILGDVLYEGTDGKYYTIHVEALIQEAYPLYVQDIKTEIATGSR
jgi:hypothetical protein